MATLDNRSYRDAGESGRLREGEAKTSAAANSRLVTLPFLFENKKSLAIATSFLFPYSTFNSTNRSNGVKRHLTNRLFGFSEGGMKMNEFIQNYTGVLKRYVDFNGRARRREYWMFFLTNFVVSTIINMLGSAVMNSSVAGLPGLIYSLAVLLPALSVGARRLHDTGKSGWWLLIGLVPIVGVIILIVFWATEGNKGANAYGADPKA